MAKPSVGFNQPQKALNRDQNNLGESDYSTLLNGLFDGIDGGSFSLTNEMSNLLSSKFKQGFKVINATNDIHSNTTYFFIVNPISGIGEIGQIKNIQQVINLEDTLSTCVGCVKYLDLAQPLETQTQTELNIYETLLTDECHILANTPKKGFMFSINHPIKKTIIKNEKCGKTIYWTDNYNSPRYLVLDKLAQYKYTGDIVCGVNQRVTTCLDSFKLPIFRKYDLPKLVPTSIQLGGRLKLGQYEFLIAYCDQMGNEISEYTSITNPIQIFDRNNVTLLQEELEKPTNFSIKLEVKDLDLRFSHYKIAVIQTSLTAGGLRYYIEGIHTINDNVVIYNGQTDDRFEVTLSDLLKENIYIEKWELLAESNNSLIGVGLTTEKEINLQPIVNLLELKWQTHVAQEDLYKDGVNVSNYLSYPRDEVVPFSIRFLLKGGYKTARFPLINRNAKISDLQTIPLTNLDRKSIESNKTRCVTSTRDKYWQYYNTATEDNSFCVGESIEVIEVDENIQKICTINNIFTIPASTYILEIDETFTDLKTYIEDNKENCIDVPFVCPNPLEVNTFPFCNYLDKDCYSAINCTPDFNNQVAKVIKIGDEYIIYSIKLGDNFTGTGYTSSGIPFIAIAQPLLWTNKTEVFKKSCTTPVKQNEEIVIGKIEGETITKIESAFPLEYNDTLITNKCNIYIAGSNSGVEIDGRGNPEAVPPDGTNYTNLMPCGQYLIGRNKFDNLTELTADLLQNVNLNTTSIQSYFNDYGVSTNVNDLIGTKPADPIALGWSATLHKQALWFKTKIEKNRFILEVTPQKNVDVVRDQVSNGDLIRVSFYAKKDSTTPFLTKIVDLTVGYKLLFEKTLTGYNITEESGAVTFIIGLTSSFYIATDCKIISQKISIIGNYFGAVTCNNTNTDAWRIAPTNGCYSIVTRDIEYSKVEVSFTSIRLDKKQTYSSICTFEKPILNSCKAIPYKKGTFAFWQSEEKYPDNNSLYNSSTLKIKPSDIPLETRKSFQDNFVILDNLEVPILNSDGDYQWRLDNLGKPLSNYTCRGIQHFKFPDNKVSPFIYENQQLSQSNSIIYPLGVTIDETTINSYLDLAVKNSLITKEKRDLISGYEIFRGNIDQDRSIISSGLLFNMRSYQQDGQTFQYSNYPYNDLGKDKLNLDSQGISYNKFTFHSPETDYYRPTLASELSIQGYVFGQTTNNYFDEVKDHPKYVILTDSAKKVARNLALLETATEIAVTIAQSAEVWRVQLTAVGGSANPVGIGMNIAAGVLSGISSVIVNYGRYRLQWLKTFRDLGEPQNFAYYNHSSANYNYIQTLQENEQSLRGIHSAKYLKPKDTTIVDDVTGQKLNINNLDREKSVFFNLGKNNDNLIEFPSQYVNYDNNLVDNNTGSLGYAKENNACAKGRSKIINKNVASPYVAIKNYLPSQYGTINSISWLSTGYKGNLKTPLLSCTPIFGGDTFISRHAVKRKIPLFHTDNFGGGDLTPFAYKQYSNIGRNPLFYIDYEVGEGIDVGQSNIIPDISYKFNLDCETRDGNYYKSPSKFYLYYYGVPSFLTETRINTWNRTAEQGLDRNFFPNVGDTGEWTQEKNVPIKTEERFFYNQVYSKSVTATTGRILYDNFEQIESDCRNDSPNGIMWSSQDSTENDYNDPYLIFNSFNKVEFPSKYGKLKDVRAIEREQILIRQEHATSLFNALDLAVDDGTKPETRNLATAFARRPLTYTETDLGYGGTQSTQSVSCEYGHFHIDAKRGQVIHIKTGGQGAEDIASTIEGKPSGMRNWFKEHLPFKILKSKIINFDQIDLDNAINGVGISMGYDSRFRRIFITKKDYILKTLLPTQTVEFSDFKYHLVQNLVKTEIKLTNPLYFEEVSWTIGFSPLEQKWIGWYSFTPNYYIAHQNYFQTGINNTNDNTEFGLWSHLLTNRSYCVFYGKKKPFIVEYMLKRTYGNLLLKSVGMDVSVERYHNEYDSAIIDDKPPFNKAVVYSPNTNSGQLNLVNNTGVLSLISQYPKTSSDNTQQDILVTKVHNEWTFNYIYNRMLSHNANQNPWIWDKNQVNKTLNKEIVKFGGKIVLEMMRSNVFSARLQQDSDTRLRYTINLLTSKTNLEQ